METLRVKKVKKNKNGGESKKSVLRIVIDSLNTEDDLFLGVNEDDLPLIRKLIDNAQRLYDEDREDSLENYLFFILDDYKIDYVIIDFETIYLVETYGKDKN